MKKMLSVILIVCAIMSVSSSVTAEGAEAASDTQEATGGLAAYLNIPDLMAYRYVLEGEWHTDERFVPEWVDEDKNVTFDFSAESNFHLLISSDAEVILAWTNPNHQETTVFYKVYLSAYDGNVFQLFLAFQSETGLGKGLLFTR